jgi:hypothetical protein
MPAHHTSPRSLETILRLRDPHQIESAPIRRVTGYAPALSLVTLFEATDISANPRLPRLNKQVRDMWGVLDNSPETFHFMNNGILLAASSCEALDRGRFRVGFDPGNSATQPREIEYST